MINNISGSLFGEQPINWLLEFLKGPKVFPSQILILAKILWTRDGSSGLDILTESGAKKEEAQPHWVPRGLNLGWLVD